MHLRFVDKADIPGLTDVACSAYLNTAFFHHLVPGRRDYPDEWRRFMAVSMTRNYLKQNALGLVCVSDLNDDFYDYDKGEEIMGYIFYNMYIQSKDVDPCNIIQWENPNEGAAIKFDRFLFELNQQYSGFCLNWLPWTLPAIDGKVMRFHHSQFQEEPFWAALPYYIDAADIAVSSKFQRRGVGKMMLAWGIKHIQKHNQETGQKAPLVLHATPEGLGLYQKLGFKILGYTPMTAPDPDDEQILFPGLMLDPQEIYTITADGKDAKNRPVQATFRPKS